MGDTQPEELTTLVGRAAGGDTEAWAAVVQRYAPLVWSVVRSFGLTDADAEDVSQVVWLRLVEHLSELRNPTALPAWLATTARREAYRVRRQRALTEDLDVVDERPDSRPSPVDTVLETERKAMLLRAFRQLPPACQSLLSVLMTEPAPSYAEISAALNLPVGSIGPSRQRCLQHLRRLLSEDAGVTEPELLGALRGGNVGVSRVPSRAVRDAVEALAAGRDRSGDGPGDAPP